VATLGEGPGPLAAWQRELLDLFTEQPGRTFRVALHTGRASGRAHAERWTLIAELARTGHVHKLTAFGGWCVTMTGLGVPLWAPLPRPRRGGPPRPVGGAYGIPQALPGGGGELAGPDHAGELAASRRQIARAYGIPQELLAGPPEAEPRERDIVAEINAVLADQADWENGDTAARWSP
jgi:hypothetical protein